MFVKHRQEGVQIIAHVHGNLRVGKYAPHGARQILVTHFRNPAPAGVINCHRQTGLEHGAWLIGKAACGKVDMPKFSVRETGAGREQPSYCRVDDPRVGCLEDLDELRPKARDDSDRERPAAGINPGRRQERSHRVMC
jgi:hypothetical protein